MTGVWWTFRSYLTARGDHVLQLWYDALGEQAQAKFDVRLRHLRQQPISGWTRPYFDKLAGKYADLGKLRFESGNVQYRPLGYFTGPHEFTFVFPEATERGSKWDPKTARDIAKARMIEIQRDGSRSDAYEFE